MTTFHLSTVRMITIEQRSEFIYYRNGKINFINSIEIGHTKYRK